MMSKLFDKLKHACLWLFYFSRFSVRQFYRQRGLQIASSLAYATLLALVPMVTVMFGFLGGLSVFENMGEAIQTFIFNNFAPAFGDSVREYLNDFSAKASRLTTTGIVILVVIALMLMSTIDGALNTIWHVRRRRNPVARFLVYWAVISLGPILLGIGLVSTSYLFSTELVSEVDVSLGLDIRSRLLSWLPFLTTSVAFTLLYVLIPNCYVSRRNALIGGVIAAILFELAKFGFGNYVTSVPTYQAIYGAIAIIPMFLVWMYMSWVIVILGAHITFCLSAFRMEFEQSATTGSDWTFIDAYLLICALWSAQKKGLPLASSTMKQYGIKLPQFQVSEIMQLLEAENWVRGSAGGAWILSRDLAEVSLMDFYQLIPRRLPTNDSLHKQNHWTGQLQPLLAAQNENLENLLQVPLRQLMVAAEELESGR